ncbi:signaling threshold-regulating transmembrane adapter 1-like [Hoplias malabaricus]|uniref:signaling threshold-regulating transmembrane adapter 1-like n=1 Tax=Hoplias malabaricus TaxID=27720 RepID=UPI00346327B4
MKECCNSTEMSGVGSLCGSVGLWSFLGVLAVVLTFSLCWNILCCIQNQLTARGKSFLPRFRRSINMKDREMEENPIYGNITYTHNRDQKEERSSQAPSSARDCYANLTLKIPKASSGRSSPVPQIQYSDVKMVPQSPEEPVEPGGNTEENHMEKDSCSLMSDLYASVDAEHVKNKKTENNEEYANRV